MQILQRLLKVSSRQAKEKTSTSASDQEKARRNNIVVVRKLGRSRGERKAKRAHKNYRPFTFVCRKDVAKACFHSTIHLSRPGKRDWVQTARAMKEGDIQGGPAIVPKVDSVSHGGNNKVLPVNDTSSRGGSREQCRSSEKKEKSKVDKAKAMSRMKELLKWAAASQAQKGGKFISRKVLNFRNRGTLKAVPDDDQLSTDSPKISFRWERYSCSTASSVYSAISLASSQVDLVANQAPSDLATARNGDHCCHHRKGNWITTDSDFVVLEL